jgi:hypothetical protein
MSVEGFLEDFARDGWNSMPVDRILALADENPDAAVEIGRRLVEREAARAGESNIVIAALQHLDYEPFAAIATHALNWLETQDPYPEGTTAEHVLVEAALQAGWMYEEHRHRVRRLLDSGGHPDLAGAWRYASEEEAALLGSELAGGHDRAELRSAWAALLHCRHLDSIAELLVSWGGQKPSYVPGSPLLWLESTGYGLDAEGLRKITPVAVYHLQLPPEINDRGRGTAGRHPTWKLDATEAAGQTGGWSSDACGHCHQPLQRLLEFDPPEHLWIKSRAHLEISICLSCAHWVDDLFYEHDDHGRPHPIERRTEPVVPDFPSDALVEGTVPIAATPQRWIWQDWMWANGNQNLHRLGGEPTWIQHPAHPECPRCGLLMQSLLQLDSDLATQDGHSYGWGSDGIGYVLWCDRCAISGVVSQCT